MIINKFLVSFFLMFSQTFFFFHYFECLFVFLLVSFCYFVCFVFVFVFLKDQLLAESQPPSPLIRRHSKKRLGKVDPMMTLACRVTTKIEEGDFSGVVCLANRYKEIN